MTFALKFRHCVEAIFLVFRVCWEAREMTCGPCFFNLKQCTTSCYSNPIWGPWTRATWNLCFSCSAAQPCTISENLYSGYCRKRTKFQRRWEVAVRCVFWKYTVQRKNHTSFLRTGFGDMRIYWCLRDKRTIFDKVRDISILLFVKFLTAFVNLSPKGGITRMRGGHVVGNCSPWDIPRRVKALPKKGYKREIRGILFKILINENDYVEASTIVKKK